MEGIAGTIFDLGKRIYEQVKLAQDNVEQCRDLQRRVDTVLQIVKGLCDMGNQDHYQQALRDLEWCLQDIIHFIGKFVKKTGTYGRFKRVFKAGKYDQKFADLNAGLADAERRLSLGLNAQHKRDMMSMRGHMHSVQQHVRAMHVSKTVPTRLTFTIPFQELHLNKELGAGRYGTVYQGTWQKMREPIAIKKLHGGTLTLQTQKDFEAETNTMIKLRSERIVQLFGICMEQNHYCLVMQFMPEGALFDLLHSGRSLDWKTRYQIGCDVADGLFYLHEANIIHRDLKSMNVLLDEHLRAKLSDFGLAMVKTETKTKATKKNEEVGSWAWMAPEITDYPPQYGRSSDMYAYGMVLWEIASRQIPFKDAPDPVMIPTWVKGGTQLPIPSDCHKILGNLIRQCWNLSTNERPGAGEAGDILKNLLKSCVTPPTRPVQRKPMPVPKPVTTPTTDLTQSRNDTHIRTHTPLATQAAGVLVSLQNANRISCIRTLQGHTYYVLSVAFSGRGDVLASGSEDNTVRLWEVCSGRLLNTLSGHTGMVWSVAFSVRGDVLASGSFDKTVRLWKVSSGRLLNTLSGHRDYVRSVAFSVRGDVLASGSYDRTVRLREVCSGRLLHTLSGHSGGVTSVAFSPRGDVLASGSGGYRGDKTVRLWEVSSGRLLKTLSGHTSFVISVAFSPRGDVLASGSADNTVRLWEVRSGRLLKTLSGHTDWVRSVAFSGRGDVLASGSNDKTVRLWGVPEK